MKKTMLWLLTLIMVMSLICIPVFAAEAWGSMSVSASAAEMTSGEEVTLTVYLDDCSALEGGVKNYKAVVTVPEGLTVKSAAIASGFDTATGMISSVASVNGNTVTVSSLGNVSGSYKGGKIAVATIVCSADKVGTYSIGFTASLTDNNFATKTPAANTTTVTVTEPAHTHVWDEGKVTTPAGCETTGVKTYTCTASGCGETKTEEIPATGHAWGEWKVTTEATCTAKGVETRICGNDASHTETRETAAKGHTYGEWTETKAPTCTEKGVETRKCACGATETREVAAKGHTYGEWTVTTAASCGKAGVETRKCACGVTETRAIAALKHVPSEAVKENVVAATETIDGSYDLVVYCSLCGEELSREKITVPALGLDDEPNTGDFTPALAMLAVVILMVPCLLVKKFRAVK